MRPFAVKRACSLALSLLLLLTLASPFGTPIARAAADITMTPALYAPILDGIIDDAEWGEPSCTVDPFAAKEAQPAYSVSGSGHMRPSLLEYWFRYDARYVYIALRVTTDYFFYNDGDFKNGTYLVPRIDKDGDKEADYLGVISLGEGDEIINKENLLSSMNRQQVGARTIPGGVEYEIAYSRYGCVFADGELALHLDYYTPGEGIVYFRNQVTVSEEDTIPLAPNVGTPCDVPKSAGKITLDGVQSSGEWGEAALTLSKEITGGARTYCRDNYQGEGLGIPDTAFFWRHDGQYLYMAVQVGESAHTGTSTFTFDDKFTVVIGAKDYVVYFENKQARSAHIPKEDLGFSYRDGVAFLELRIPLAKLGEGVTVGDTVLGYVEYYNTVIYTDGDGYTQVSGITTRSVANFRAGGDPVNAFTLQ